MKVVLDTNVLVAGILNPKGTPAAILNLILNEEIFICYDDRIISSEADYLVTGNTKHFSHIKDNRITTPSEFMAEYHC